METMIYEKANDYAVRKIITVEKIEEISLDELIAKKEYLQQQKEIGAAYYDKCIAEIDTDIAEATKIEVVSEKVAIAEAEALQAAVIEESLIDPIQ